MLEAFSEGLVNLFQPLVFLALLGGIVLGVILGILPGLQCGMGMILLLPFMFGQDPVICLPVMVALTSVGNMGGALTAVLLGIPGESSNAATVLDAFPMTRKGEGARALGAAVFSSVTGGLLSVVFAFAMIPLVIAVVMQFKSSEMFLTIVIGLCFLAYVTKGSTTKGLISACLGLLLATIGMQIKTGVARFTFGIMSLYSGFEMIPILMGCFAVPVLAELIVTGKTIAPLNQKSAGNYRDMFKGMRDVFHHWWLWLRCCIIGYIIGVIPGIGGETAIWASYGYAKQSSKEPGKFGTGCMEGVIAPQSAVSAKEAGDLLTTLALGIPGSGIMVMLLAAMMVVGIQPGPNMLTENTALSFTLLLSVAVSNLVAGIICLGGAPFLTKITRVSPVYLFCFTMPLLFIGIYSYNGAMTDLLVLVIISIFGVILAKYGYSLPALVMGFILGDLAEYYFWHAVDFGGPIFFTSPISLLLIVFTIVFFAQKPIGRFFTKRLKPRIRRIP